MFKCFWRLCIIVFSITCQARSEITIKYFFCYVHFLVFVLNNNNNNIEYPTYANRFVVVLVVSLSDAIVLISNRFLHCGLLFSCFVDKTYIPVGKLMHLANHTFQLSESPGKSYIPVEWITWPAMCILYSIRCVVMQFLTYYLMTLPGMPIYYWLVNLLVQF